jgi:hypothetical protein
VPQLLAREARHALRQRRALGIAIQETQRRGRRLQFAVGVVEQQFGHPLACLVEPGFGCRRFEKRGNVVRHA